MIVHVTRLVLEFALELTGAAGRSTIGTSHLSSR